MKKRGLIFLAFFALIVVTFLYFVLAASNAPTAEHFESNTTLNYDKEGNFTFNWTAPGAGDSPNNYSIWISVDGGTSYYTRVWNNSATGYAFSNSTNANYTFKIGSVNATGNETNSSTTISMVVDTINPAISYGTGIADDNANVSRTWIFANVSASDTNNHTITFFLYNSTAIVNQTSYTNSYATLTINWTGLAQGTYYYNVTANDSATNSNSTSTRTITLDTTAPTITLPVYTNGTSKKNTNQLTLNISITDSNSGLFGSLCIVNVNGTNESISVSNGWCNSTSINLTGLTDGNRTINVYVNDSSNNTGLNNSFVVQIDTTAPSASPSCAPSSISVGASFPCSCSGSDATSGVATTSGSSNSPDGTSTPSNTGVFTYTCGATDNAGNSASATASYTVEQIGSSRGGSGGGGGSSITNFWAKGTYSITEQQFSQGHSMEILARQRVKVRVSNEDHYVGVKEVNPTTAKIEISSVPQEKILSVGEEWKAEVNGDDYYDLSVKLTSIQNNKAIIFVKSIYELIPQETPEGQPQEQQIEETPQITGEATEGEIKEGKSLAWLWGLIVILIIIFIVWFVIPKKKKR